MFPSLPIEDKYCTSAGKVWVRSGVRPLPCYGNLGPPKILVLGTKFSGKISPGGPILPENFDPCPKVLVLPLSLRLRVLYTRRIKVL